MVDGVIGTLMEDVRRIVVVELRKVLVNAIIHDHLMEVQNVKDRKLSVKHATPISAKVKK